MKLKQIIFASILFIFINYNQTQGQHQLGKPTWEIGTDMLWLIGKENIPYSIFLKNHRNKLKKNEFKTIKYAYRLRLGLDFTKPLNNNTQIYYQNITYQFYSNLNIYFRPGYEIKKPLKSFEVLFGLDIPVNYSSSDVRTISFTSGVQQEVESKSKGIYLGVAPVIGVSYTLAKSIKFTLESSLDILYGQGNQKDRIISPDQQLLLNSSHNDINIYFFPIHTINISVLL